MQTTAFNRPSINSTQSVTEDDANKTDAVSCAGTIKGYGHLLEGVTLEDALKQHHFDGRLAELLDSFLVHGEFPSTKRDVGSLASWMVCSKQPILLCKVLSIAPAIINVFYEEFAARFLAIMQSGLSYSGLTLQMDMSLPENERKKIVPLLEQAFQANSSLTAIEILSQGQDFNKLTSLFDVLTEVKNLTFIARARQMDAADCALISNLLSKNKTMRALELCDLGADDMEDQDDSSDPECLAIVIDELAGQLQLERLSLNKVPQHKQSLLGHFLCSSQSLTDLHIKLGGLAGTEPLIAAFSQNMSIKNVHLELPNLEDGRLLLIAGIAKNKGSIKSLTLTTRERRADSNETPCICELIAGNSFLISLAWRFSSDSNVDLVQIGTALEKNKRLESLVLDAISKPDKHPYYGPQDWVNHGVVPDLIKKLKNNKTLLTLALSDEKSTLDNHKEKFPELQQVLQRNLSWQRYACSDAFITGATEGFFASLQMPMDIATVAAGYLMHLKPRIDVGALALVNKASYDQALSRRRQAHADMLDQWLPIADEFAIDDSKGMIELLNGIAASKEDFSVADFSRIAESPSLAMALEETMRFNPPNYLSLIKNFIQAVGMDKMRSMMIAACTNTESAWNWESGQLLFMLEQSFPPDQEHLLPFIEKELNSHSIDSTVVQLFVDYKISLRGMGRKKEFVSWCIKNQRPGVLLAFQENKVDPDYLTKIEIDFNKYPSVFSRGIMERIPLLKNASVLIIKGVPEYEDALVLHRVLAESTILEELRIDGSHCGPELELILQGLSLNTRISDVLLTCRRMAQPPAICDKIAQLLGANQDNLQIILEVYKDDPELSDLEALAATEPRLNLHLQERHESSSDSDEAPVH